MYMRNYDYWKLRKEDNKNKIILFLSWFFYRTFNSDSKFLSDKFWFKIKQIWWYEVVWFPKNALSKYINELKKEKVWYILYEKWENNDFKLKEEFKWWNSLIYNSNNLVYLEKKLENKNINIEIDKFKNFLNDLEKIILKYK